MNNISGMNGCHMGAVCIGQILGGKFIPLNKCVDNGVLTREEYDEIVGLNFDQSIFRPLIFT